MQGSILFRIVNAPLCAALLCLAAAFVSFGQFETATVLGTATDPRAGAIPRSEEHTPELPPLRHLVCRLLLEQTRHEPNLHARQAPLLRDFAQPRHHTML